MIMEKKMVVVGSVIGSVIAIKGPPSSVGDYGVLGVMIVALTTISVALVRLLEKWMDRADRNKGMGGDKINMRDQVKDLWDVHCGTRAIDPAGEYRWWNTGIVHRIQDLSSEVPRMEARIDGKFEDLRGEIGALRKELDRVCKKNMSNQKH